jgi:hypothetical protein
MATAFDEAWATDEERPNLPSMSRDELIAEFSRLDALVKRHGRERKEIGAALASIALENKGAQNTVHLASTDGQRIRVEFGVDYEYETGQMLTAADLLGKEQFDSLFKTRVEFIAKKRELKMFLNTVSSDERIESAKRIIKDATIPKEKAPYVSVE